MKRVIVGGGTNVQAFVFEIVRSTPSSSMPRKIVEHYEHDGNKTYSSIEANTDFKKYGNTNVTIANNVEKNVRIELYGEGTFVINKNVASDVLITQYGNVNVTIKGDVDPSLKFNIRGEMQLVFEKYPPQEVLDRVKSKAKITVPANCRANTVTTPTSTSSTNTASMFQPIRYVIGKAKAGKLRTHGVVQKLGHHIYKITPHNPTLPIPAWTEECKGYPAKDKSGNPTRFITAEIYGLPYSAAEIIVDLDKNEVTLDGILKKIARPDPTVKIPARGFSY